MFSATFRDDTTSIRVSVLTQWRPDTNIMIKFDVQVTVHRDKFL